MFGYIMLLYVGYHFALPTWFIGFGWIGTIGSGLKWLLSD